MTIDKDDDDQVNSVSEHRRWIQELKLAENEDKTWLSRCDKIVKRYRDERKNSVFDSNNSKYNILWSNIQTLLPALYGRTPKAQVERRWKDKDPVGRTASVIMERVLQYEIDHYGDYDNAVRLAVLDRLIPGRGVAWVRFEQKDVELPESMENESKQDVKYECTPTDYVFWKDFRCSPARTWDEVTWVARRVYITKNDGVIRFGEEFKEVPLTHSPTGIDEMKTGGVSQSDIESMQKAQVWEIWSKPDERVYWVAEGHNKLLDSRDDPYGLDKFWPCPKPLFATQTSDTLVPIPDFSMYQDQAREIDNLTSRISMLSEAIKVVGVYDASQSGVQRMLSEGVNNTLIPVDTWAAFGEKGGLKGVVEFLPLDMVITAIEGCYRAREQSEQTVYKITGLSDIIRGASVASETATAQQIKSQYASLRLKYIQNEVAKFCSEILQIKAQIISDLYSPESLIQMSGISGTDDAQYAEQAIMLIKQEPARSFRIEVAADSLVEMDEEAEKSSRNEFMSSFGTLLRDAFPMVQAAPEIGPLIGEVLQFVARTFRGGRQLENVLENTVSKMNEPKPPQPPQPDPEQIKAQSAIQLEQSKQAAQAQVEQFKAQFAGQLEQAKMQHEIQIEQMRQEAETSRAQMKATTEQETRLRIAAMQTGCADAQQFNDNGREIISTHTNDDVIGMINQSNSGIANAVGMMANLLSTMSKPKKRLLERGPDGRAIGIIEVIDGDQDQHSEPTTDIGQAIQMMADAEQKIKRKRRRTIQRGPDGRANGIIEISEEDENGNVQ